MTYGTLEYWRRQADSLGRECASQRAEITALWTRLVAVETIAASKGVDVNDPELTEHSMEIAAIHESYRIERDALDEMRTSIIGGVFMAEDAIGRGVLDKAAAFDALCKLITKCNTAAHRKPSLPPARDQIAARRKAWADLDAKGPADLQPPLFPELTA